jgi:hypothetical protein
MIIVTYEVSLSLRLLLHGEAIVDIWVRWCKKHLLCKFLEVQILIYFIFISYKTLKIKSKYLKNGKIYEISLNFHLF